MNKDIMLSAALALVLSFPASAAIAKEQSTSPVLTTTATQQAVVHFTGEGLSKQAKVSIIDARAIALKAHPGKITDEELETEGGGSGLRYSFDIKQGAVVHEVGVDAKTGKVLENSEEGPHPD